MPDIYVLGESKISLTGGVTLDGITQGDGSHLVGEFLTLNAGGLEPVEVKDNPWFDNNFDDNDNNQRLDGTQTIDGITYNNNTRIEAEYQFEAIDNATGQIYRIIAVNFNNSNPSFGTNEALAFVGAMPPIGTPLEVISASEGPGSFGQSSISYNSFVTCFLKGTGIAAPSGKVEISRLVAGDRVQNEAGESLTIRWIGHRKITKAELERNEKLRPVRIMAGTLGDGLPKSDLIVSRQHRMLVRSQIAQRMFGQDEVLIPAIKLTELPGIFIDHSIEEVEYFHLLFDQHEIIFAEGAPTESLFTGPQALEGVSAEAREEILTLFPEVAELDYEPKPARYIPEGRLQKQLIARHLKNEKPLLA